MFGVSADHCTIVDGDARAPDGDTRGLNALIGVAAYAGPTEIELGLGPAWYWSERTVPRGTPFRVDLMGRTKGLTFGLATRVPLIPTSLGFAAIRTPLRLACGSTEHHRYHGGLFTASPMKVRTGREH